MKQNLTVLAVICCIVTFAGFIQAQVFVDFEVAALGTDGFNDNGWGSGFTSVSRIADPTGNSGGVMAIACNGAQGWRGVIQKDNLEAMGAQVISAKIYLPANFPANGTIAFWSQDNSHWTGFPNTRYQGANLPKEKWIAVNFQLKFLDLTVENFDPYAPNKMGKFGIEIAYGPSETDYNNTFTGQVLVDDFTYVGVEPTTLSDFEIEALGTDNFTIAWGNAITGVARIADPSGNSTGVLEITADGSLGDKKAAFQRADVPPNGAHVLVFHVWLPAGFPDDVLFQLFAQDKNGWEWSQQQYSAADIPKETWIPLNYDILTKYMIDPNLDPYTNNIFGKVGIQVLFLGTAWSGTILVDNVQFLGIETGLRWVVADFENANRGTYGWINSGWGAGLIEVKRSENVPESGNRVMEMVIDFGAGPKATLLNDGFSVTGVDKDGNPKVADRFSFDVYLPADFPSAGMKTFGQDRVIWSWQEDGYNVSTLKLGAWNTVSFDVASRIANVAGYDVSNGLKAGLEFYLEGSTWSGSVYVDNVTLHGVAAKKGTLQSPSIITAAAFDDLNDPFTGKTIYYKKIEWVDLADDLGETYNIYVSATGPITNVTAAGIITMAKEVGRGVQVWNHRVYSTDGAETTHYYAVTVNGLDPVTQDIIETPVLDGVSNTGPITGPSTITQVIPLVDNFDFEIDGDIDEFRTLAETFTRSQLRNESASGPAGGSWTIADKDCNFEMYLVMDSEFLYIGAEVIDDDPSGAGQAWQGDGFDVFMGFYDISQVTVMHGKNAFANDVGDYRISYAINAASWDQQLQRNGYEPWALEGADHDADIADSSYVVEIMIPFASLTDGPAFTPTSGTWVPLKVDVNDNDGPDDPLGDGRTLQLHWGGTPGNTEGWMRPETFGWAMITNDPTVDVNDHLVTMPKTTQLYGNYPNPFNPGTTINYELANSVNVELTIYDVLGRAIKTLVNKRQATGNYSVVWDGSNNSGASVSSGVYFIQFKAGDYQKVHKMMLVK